MAVNYSLSWLNFLAIQVIIKFISMIRILFKKGKDFDTLRKLIYQIIQMRYFRIKIKNRKRTRTTRIRLGTSCNA